MTSFTSVYEDILRPFRATFLHPAATYERVCTTEYDAFVVQLQKLFSAIISLNAVDEILLPKPGGLLRKEQSCLLSKVSDVKKSIQSLDDSFQILSTLFGASVKNSAANYKQLKDSLKLFESALGIIDSTAEYYLKSNLSKLNWAEKGLYSKFFSAYECCARNFQLPLSEKASNISDNAVSKDTSKFLNHSILHSDLSDSSLNVSLNSDSEAFFASESCLSDSSVSYRCKSAQNDNPSVEKSINGIAGGCFKYPSPNCSEIFSPCLIRTAKSNDVTKSNFLNSTKIMPSSNIQASNSSDNPASFTLHLSFLNESSKKIVEELMSKVSFPTNKLDFAPTSSKKPRFICKLCNVILLPAKVEEHINCELHLYNMYLNSGILNY